jgi:hypothetical protein
MKPKKLALNKKTIANIRGGGIDISPCLITADPDGQYGGTYDCIYAIIGSKVVECPEPIVSQWYTCNCTVLNSCMQSDCNYNSCCLVSC